MSTGFKVGDVLKPKSKIVWPLTESIEILSVEIDHNGDAHCGYRANMEGGQIKYAFSAREYIERYFCKFAPFFVEGKTYVLGTWKYVIIELRESASGHRYALAECQSVNFPGDVQLALLEKSDWGRGREPIDA